MQTTPKNLLKLGRLTPSQLLQLAQTVVDRITGNALYPTPAPTLIQIGTDITNLTAAIVARGTKRNKGTASDTVTLSSAVATIKQDLVALAKYVVNTTPYDKDALVTTGFVIKGKKHKSKRLQTIRNGTAKMSRALNADEVLIAWKKPLGGVKGNDNRIWEVRVGATPDFTASKVLTQTTQGKVITNKGAIQATGIALTNGQQIYFWITGQNGFGKSVVSNIITAHFIDLSA